MSDRSREPAHEREYKNRVYFALRKAYPQLTRDECKTLAFAANVHMHHPEGVYHYPIPDDIMREIRLVGKAVEVYGFPRKKQKEH